jgi:hypothetical protein
MQASHEALMSAVLRDDEGAMTIGFAHWRR